MLKSRFKIIFVIIISIIIISGISVYATYNYFAKDVMYTKADGTEIDVEKALNELYNERNKKSLVCEGNDFFSGTTVSVKEGYYYSGYIRSKNNNTRPSIISGGECNLGNNYSQYNHGGNMYYIWPIFIKATSNELVFSGVNLISLMKIELK